MVQGAKLQHSEPKALLLPGAEGLVRTLRKVAHVSFRKAWYSEDRTQSKEAGEGRWLYQVDVLGLCAFIEVHLQEKICVLISMR